MNVGVMQKCDDEISTFRWVHASERKCDDEFVLSMLTLVKNKIENRS